MARLLADRYNRTMKVLVTGGTGYVGARIVAHLVGAGHAVRMLVRRPEQVPVSLAPYAVTVEDLVVGDVLDQAAVSRAVEGCDAVVHAAAIFSLDAGRAKEIEDTNATAAELVLSRAVAAGLDPVVHISSTVALTRYGGSGPDLPLGDVTSPYSRSKIASELVARRLQDQGAPVVSVYPGGVYGPHDPYRGVNSELLRWILRGLFPTFAPGSTHAVDVRTVAETVLAALVPGQGPRRYVVPGVRLDADLLYGTVERVTGRRVPHVVAPASLVVPLTRVTAFLQRPLPSRWHYPADVEGTELAIRDTVFDDSPARIELGVEPVPFEQSVRDTVRWLVEAGRLRPRYAGKALSTQG
jgi:dihydroflavonol-4-reductase